MDDLEVSTDRQADGPTITTLTGIVKDQAGLHGLLNRIRDLSIPLISVQFIHPFFQKRSNPMEKNRSLTRLVLKAVALGMSVPVQFSGI